MLELVTVWFCFVFCLVKITTLNNLENKNKIIIKIKKIEHFFKTLSSINFTIDKLFTSSIDLLK